MSLRITARPARGIRRVGVFHPAAPVVFPDEYFEDHDLEILRHDPDLIVEEGDFIEPGTAEGLSDLRLRLLNRGSKTEQPGGAGSAGSADAGDPGEAPDGRSNSGAESPGSPAAASGGDVTDASQQQPADVAGDRTQQEAEKEIPTPPAVADLEAFLTEITDIMVVREMQRRDTRKSAQPIYEAWIDQLTPGASRQGG